MKLRYTGKTDIYNVKVAARSDTIVEVKGPADMPFLEIGFDLIGEENGEEVIYNYARYSTLYRKIEDGCYQYSCDGSTYISPVKDITFNVEFDIDESIEDVELPDHVTLSISMDDTVEDVILSPETGWSITYSNIPIDSNYAIVDIEDIDGFERNINGYTVIYSIQEALEPSLEEQVYELAEVVAELDERVYTLEEGSADV